MDKIETLLKLAAGNFETRKGNNLSKRPIDSAIIEQIENGLVTSEMLAGFVNKWPVLKYKTCITLHGLFNLSSIPRIGGYKNVIPNKNGSIEVKYSAIDLDKKKKLRRILQATESDWSGWYDSNGSSFQLSETITSAEQLAEIRPRFQTLAARIGEIEIFGSIHLFLAVTPWGSRRLVLELRLDALFENSVIPLAEILTGKSESEITADCMALDREDAVKKAQWEKHKIEMDIQDEKKALILTEMRKPIDNNKPFTGEIGRIGIKATEVQGKPAYYMVKAVSKSSFGRVNYQFAFAGNLESVKDAKFRDSKKAKKPAEFVGFVNY